jgi:UDP-GlcNAc:undecaprenyl-phosphate GlcNAc-1-phosphate transferase
MIQFLPIMAVGFAAAYGFTPITKQLAVHWNIVDQPNQRKVHKQPTPLLGGLAIYAAFFVATALFTPADFLVEFGAVLAGGLWLALVGYVDDRQGMQPSTKMTAQWIASLILILSGIRIELFGLLWLDIPLTMLWVIGITNAMNLMDNMDGLAAGVTAIAAGMFFILAASQELILVSSLAAALCGATLGFLRYNFSPASTFMGDAGSLVIGFILAVLSIKLEFPAQSTVVTWAIPLLVLAIPIFDTSLVTFTRLRERRSPFQGGKDHTSHRIAQMGLSHRRTVVVMYGLAIVMGLLALAISQVATSVALGLIVVAAVLALGLFISLERSYIKSQ